MKFSGKFRRSTTTAVLLGTASVISLGNAHGAQAQEVAQGQTAEAQVPEQVLVTGSLIRGTVAVGAPVTELSDQDFKQTGALTTADVLKDVPAITLEYGSQSISKSRGDLVQAQNAEIHNIGGDQSAPKTLLMVDGLRTDPQGHLCIIDPSIIPQLAVDRIDVLADGASATYGSDAIAGVINVILKRGYDGAVTQFQVGGSPDIGGLTISGSQLFGRTWDGGDITLTYEYYHINPVLGPARSYYTFDFSPWGLNNITPITSASPGIASTGAPATSGAPPGFSATAGTNCTNCYSIPKGQNGVGLTWAQILANKGEANEFDPYDHTSILPEQQRNAFVATFDQDVYRGGGLVQSVQFFAEGYYNNRRANLLSPATVGATLNNALTISVPTTNPYYPVGAPGGLRVSYSFSPWEVQGENASASEQGRYEMGFNIALPSDWVAKISYDKTEDNESTSLSNAVNPNLVNAAIGNTVAAANGFTSYTKPPGLPYLNLFCDPQAFRCNDPQTLSYITAHNLSQIRLSDDEVNLTFDGPLFDIPGGPVRFAIGGDYFSPHYNYHQQNGSTSQTGDTNPAVSLDKGAFNDFSVFGQLNVPLVSQQNAIPFVERLEFEASGRIDKYSNVGYTKNPKLALTWDVGLGFTFRGSIGTSFRAPSFVDLTPYVGAVMDPLNVAGGAASNTYTTCTPGQKPVPGSIAAILNPTCSAALANPGGITVGGGSGNGQQVRPPGYQLQPESARNWNVGFDFAPTGFLSGLDINSTLWYVKINGAMQAADVGGGLDDPLSLQDGRFIPYTDPNFQTYLNNILKNPFHNPAINASNVLFIEDNAERNTGFLLYQGIDFSASYVIDLGALGAWNTGVTGTYQLDRAIEADPGFPVVDDFQGRDSGGRLDYRARLGWAGGPDDAWSVTAFMNYHPHIGNLNWGDNVRFQSLPPSCFMQGNPSCASYGAPFAQYTSQFPFLSNYEPAWYSFDLSLGYKTGDRPRNDYLKNVAIQLTVNNLLNKEPLFAYITSTSGGSPEAFDRRYDPLQRTIVLAVTKAW